MSLFDDLYLDKEIVVRGSTYRVIMPPVQEGQLMGVCWKESQEAFHWQLWKQAVGSSSRFLLKVMKPGVRAKRLSDLQEKLQKHYRQVAAFPLDQRICLTYDTDNEILRQFPELEYAILMPWLSWPTWAELVQALSNKQAIQYTLQQAQQLSATTAEALCAMEIRGHAHTDIAGSNVLYTPDAQHVALVDLEGFYMPDPDLPIPATASLGTPGYQHHETKRNGQRSSLGDRFAGAILLTEMLTLWSPDIQASLSPGATTLFQERELQEVQGDQRRDLVYRVLQSFGNTKLPELFKRAWDSPQISDCPSLGEWFDAIKAIQGSQPQLTSSTSQQFAPPLPNVPMPDPATFGSHPSQPNAPKFGQTTYSAPNPSPTSNPMPAPPPVQQSKGIQSFFQDRRKFLLTLMAGGIGAAALSLAGWEIARSYQTEGITNSSTPTTAAPSPTPTPPPTPTPYVSSLPSKPVGLSSSLAPALMVWQQKLYMYYVDTTPNQGNSLTVVPTDNLNLPQQIANHASSQPPALVDQGSTLMMAYVANNSFDTLLTATSTDGLTWSGETTLSQFSATAPALAFVGSTTYMAFVSDDSDHVILISSDVDGFNSNQPTTFNSDLAPALLAGQDGQTLIMAFVDTKRNSDILITTSTDGSTWSATHPTNQTASATPAMAYLNSTLYLVFVANDGSSTLQFISSQDLVNWSAPKDGGGTSAGAPTLAAWNQGLTLAYVNRSDSLQIASSQE